MVRTQSLANFIHKYHCIEKTKNEEKEYIKWPIKNEIISSSVLQFKAFLFVEMDLETE